VAPTVVGTSTIANWSAGTAGGVSVTPSMPAGVQAGDLLLAFVWARLATISIDTASGYTRISGDNVTTTNLTAEVQAKIAGSSEAAPAFTAGPVTPQPFGVVLMAVRNWSGTIGDLVFATPNAGSSISIVHPDATAVVADSLAVRWFFNSDDNSRPVPPAAAPGEPPDAPSGHTQAYWELTTVGSDANAGVYYQAGVSAGAIGTATVTVSGGDTYLAGSIVVPPLVTGSPTNAPATAATGTGTANNAAGSIKPPAGTTGSGAAHNASTLIGAAAIHATAVAAALTPSVSVRASAECATGAGAANPAVFSIPSHPAGPRITSTSPRGRIGTSTQPPITSTSPRGWL
jgi:hypothetical protein